MTDPSRPPTLVRRTQNLEDPLTALEAVRDLRRYLSEVERQAVMIARERGASVEEVAGALGVTRQAVYYKIKHLGTQAPAAKAKAGIVQIPDLAERTADPGPS